MSEEDGKDLGVDLGKELGAGAAGEPDKGISVTPGGGLPPPKFKNSSGNSLRSPQDLSTQTSILPAEHTPSQATPPIPIPDQNIAEEGMSARERNKLKRKRKAEGKSGPAPPPSVAPPKIAAPIPVKKELSDAENDVETEKEGRKRVKLEEGTSDDNVGDSSVSLVDRSLQGSGGHIEPIASTSSIVIGYKGKAEGVSLDGGLEVEVGKWPWGKCVELLVGGEDSGLKS